jgi:hypothetical protein
MSQNHPTFPIVIKCKSSIEAETANLVNTAIQGLSPDLNDNELAEALMTSGLVKGIQSPLQGPFYPLYSTSAGYRLILRDYQ